MHVLAVMSSYEIELFVERSLSGKIIKVQAGGSNSDANGYGYKSVNKKITINEEEVETVCTIFEMYAKGISVIDIADQLNANNIPSPYAIRTKKFAERRKAKGLEEKKYKFDVDKLKWRASTISRILSRKLYTGERHIIFYESDPTNTLPTKKRTDRKILFEYNEHCEDLRIITDELFQAVQDRLSKAKYNKNNAIKHDNLLKHKLQCGECGGNFSVGNSMTNSSMLDNKRTYKCYGIISRKDKKKTCEYGSEIRQIRLDGLVVHYSLKMFAEIASSDNNQRKIKELETDIDRLSIILSRKKNEQQQLEENYKSSMRRLMKVNNKIVEELIAEETSKFEEENKAFEKSIIKINRDIINKRIRVNQLKKMSETYENLYNKMHEIRQNKDLVKQMIDEYIDVIQIYRINPNWNLVIIKYKNDVEIWGTIKAARYKNDEMFYDDLVCKYGVEYKSWCVDNSDKSFSYNKDNHKVIYNGKSSIELYRDIQAGEYDYDEFNQILTSTENLNSFPLYYYEEK